MAELTIDTVQASAPEQAPVDPPRWERAECTCPDWCERDHELD